MTDTEIPETVATMHFLAADGRWLCQIPLRELRHARFDGRFQVFPEQAGDETLRCHDCWRRRQLQLGSTGP